MELLRLADISRPTVRQLPETGMGFQLLEETGLLGGKAIWLVLHGEYAVSLDESPETERWLRARFSYEPLNAWLSGQGALDTVELRTTELVMQRTSIARGPYNLATPREAVPPRSALIKRTRTATGQKFFRLSASSNDKRVDQATGNFVPGTYATTATDLPFAPSGFAAVGRYALPNVEPASYCYEIAPQSGTEIHIGTVAPAYGQAGGGVEVCFPDGAVNVGQVVPRRTLPDE